jgi:hypothetical protein
MEISGFAIPKINGFPNINDVINEDIPKINPAINPFLSDGSIKATANATESVITAKLIGKADDVISWSSIRATNINAA